MAESKYLTDEQFETIGQWGMKMKSEHPEVCGIAYMTTNDFVSMVAFSSTPKQVGQRVVLVEGQIVNGIQAYEEFEVTGGGYIWLEPEPNETTKQRITEKIIKMADVNMQSQKQ